MLCCILLTLWCSAQEITDRNNIYIYYKYTDTSGYIGKSELYRRKECYNPLKVFVGVIWLRERKGATEEEEEGWKVFSTFSLGEIWVQRPFWFLLILFAKVLVVVTGWVFLFKVSLVFILKDYLFYCFDNLIIYYNYFILFSSLNFDF